MYQDIHENHKPTLEDKEYEVLSNMRDQSITSIDDLISIYGNKPNSLVLIEAILAKLINEYCKDNFGIDVNEIRD